MVTATRHLTYGPPIAASPARLRADPSKLSFIRAWIRDFPAEGMSSDAGAITEKLKELSFDSIAWTAATSLCSKAKASTRNMPN